MNQLDTLRDDIRQFVSERGWDRHHNPKNLSMALAVEAAEVLEHFQWCSEAESFALTPEKRREVAHELCDVLMGSSALPTCSTSTCRRPSPRRWR